MQSFLAKCAAVGIVAGGFTLTGDLGRLAERGKRLLESRTVPSEAAASPADDVTEPHGAAAPESTTADSAATPAPVAAPGGTSRPADDWPFSGGVDPARRFASPVAVPPPPTNGPDAVDPRHLSTGQRLLVWVRRSASGLRGPPVELVALDMIDPTGAEALEQRHVPLESDGEARVTFAPPRRVVIVDPGRIAKGSPLRLAPRQVRGELAPPESPGTVVAIEVQGR